MLPVGVQESPTSWFGFRTKRKVLIGLARPFVTSLLQCSSSVLDHDRLSEDL